MKADDKGGNFGTKTLRFGSVIAVIIAASIAGTLAKLGVKEIFEPHQLTKEEALERTVKKLKADLHLPKQIDEITLLTNIMANPYDGVIIYEMMISDVKIQSNKDKNIITKKLKKNVERMCSMRDTENLFKMGISYQWNYAFPISGEGIAITLKPEDCLKNRGAS